MNNPYNDRQLTVSQVAELFGVERRTVRLWYSTRSLPIFRTPGGHVRIGCRRLVAWLKKCGRPIPPELEAEVTK